MKGASSSSSASNNLVEAEKQIDLRMVTPNPFVSYYLKDQQKKLYNSPSEEYFQQLTTSSGNIMNTLPKMTKIWISPFQERSRYATEFEECCPIGTGTFSKVTCVRHR